MQKPIVFISYSHKDEGWKERLLTHLGVLRETGILESWDDRRIGGGDDWELKIEEAMKSASLAILLISANSLTSDFILHKEITTLLQRRHSEGLRIFPMIIKPCDWQAVGWLRTMNLRPKDGRPLSSGSEYQIDADLAEVAKEIRALISQGITITPLDRSLPLAPERISLSRLPVTDSHLFGRDTDLELLDEVWAAQTTKVISLVAWGGVGKSALVNHWLRRLAKDNYRGAEQVFAWSFYTQGAEERSASADVFIDTALRWFGDPMPTEGNAWDRGERLARLIRTQRTLLILDGLEPLQFPPGPREGELKEQHLQALLRELAAHSLGLCLISSRVRVSDLKDYEESTAKSVDLETLSPSAGAQLLKTQGVKGSEIELEQTAKEVGGHCLALTLLGTYLTNVCSGDIRRRGEIGMLAGEDRVGEQARQIMNSYERWFGIGPELALLRLLGLFNRPADKDSIAALRRRPLIKGLTDSLGKLDDWHWQQCLVRLRKSKLLAPSDPAEPHTIDAHPLVREHFGAQLRQQFPKAWREGNNRLYEHLTLTAAPLPDTIQQMAPLYSALAHGCHAGRASNALREVYVKRICRGDEFFNMSKLGALGADLTCIAAFFEKPWSKLLDGLTEENEGALLNWAGTRLSALGRLYEAVEPLNGALRIYAALTDFENAAKNARSLSELLMTTGDLQDALLIAHKSVNYAYEFGRGAPIKVFSRSILASVLHQMGRLLEAEAEFQEAEKEQERIQPQFPLLIGLWGFQYCELLLDRGKYKEVEERVLLTSNWPERFLGLLDLALNQLCLARAYLLEAQDTGSRDYSKVMTHLTTAMKKLRQSGRQDYLPQGLLTSAELWTAIGDFQRARVFLDETEAITMNNAMRLQVADCHLKRSILYLAEDDKAHARTSLTLARRIIETTGYLRRNGAALAISQRLDEC
jgi:tetratricopeptide (TPR) repeat protein